MTNLPVLQGDQGYLVPEPDTAELLPVREASDRALAAAAEQLAQLDAEVLRAKRAIAAELRDRYGVGKAHAGGFSFAVTESVSWPVGATEEALRHLLERGVISHGDYDRAMPLKPSPNRSQLKALIGRLMTSDPEAAKLLADAATTSPPSVRDVVAEAVEGRAA